MGRIRLLLQSSSQVGHDLPGDLAEGIRAKTSHHGSGKGLQEFRIGQHGLDQDPGGGVRSGGLTL